MTPLSIRLSDAACRHATEGDLAHSERGMECHVALNLGERVGQSRRVTMSVEAWLILLGWLQREKVTVPGATTSEQARAACLGRAHRKISREFMRLAKHPAYRGVAVAGTSTTKFPAYTATGDRWWPTPDMAFANSDGTDMKIQVTELVPRERWMNGRIFTEWVVLDTSAQAR